MQNLLRISVLTTCLAIGIAVAVAVGLRKPPDKAAPAAAPPPLTPVSIGAPEWTGRPQLQSLPQAFNSEQERIATETARHIFEPLAPMLAPYREPVAQQVEPNPPVPPASNPFADDPAPGPAAPAPAAAASGAAAAAASQPAAEQLPPGDQIITTEGDDGLSINAQNTDIRQVLELLSVEGNINIMASKNVTGAVTANLTKVDIDTA